jgi:hypothetical protein
MTTDARRILQAIAFTTNHHGQLARVAGHPPSPVLGYVGEELGVFAGWVVVRHPAGWPADSVVGAHVVWLISPEPGDRFFAAAIDTLHFVPESP